MRFRIPQSAFSMSFAAVLDFVVWFLLKIFTPASVFPHTTLHETVVLFFAARRPAVDSVRNYLFDAFGYYVLLGEVYCCCESRTRVMKCRRWHRGCEVKSKEVRSRLGLSLQGHRCGRYDQYSPHLSHMKRGPSKGVPRPLSIVKNSKGEPSGV